MIFRVHSSLNSCGIILWSPTGCFGYKSIILLVTVIAYTHAQTNQVKTATLLWRRLPVCYFRLQINMARLYIENKPQAMSHVYMYVHMFSILMFAWYKEPYPSLKYFIHVYWYKSSYYSFISLVQVRLRQKTLHTPSGLELVCSRSWQRISCHWVTCSYHWASVSQILVYQLEHIICIGERGKRDGQTERDLLMLHTWCTYRSVSCFIGVLLGQILFVLIFPRQYTTPTNSLGSTVTERRIILHSKPVLQYSRPWRHDIDVIGAAPPSPASRRH